MPRRKIEKENTRKIQKSHNMYYVSIPIELMRKLKWKEQQKVIVKKFGKGLQIKDWPVRQAQGKPVRQFDKVRRKQAPTYAKASVGRQGKKQNKKGGVA